MHYVFKFSSLYSLHIWNDYNNQKNIFETYNAIKFFTLLGYVTLSVTG